MTIIMLQYNQNTAYMLYELTFVLYTGNWLKISLNLFFLFHQSATHTFGI